MEKRIVRRELTEKPAELSDLPELLQRIYAHREVKTSDQLSRELVDLHSYSLLKNIQSAAELLYKKLSNNKKILIIGDFDADGATSTTLAVKALRAFGCDDVDFLIPNRFDYGYGLTPEIVAVATTLSPDLIITVDNGISSIAGVKAAREAGIDVLVTDHHLPGDALPDDCVIVNPNLDGDEFPSKCIAGVGVIFYVMLALRAVLKENGWFEKLGIPVPNMACYLDLVALGTVADVVSLDRNNRIMVYHGLSRIRAGKASRGILALIEIAGRQYKQVKASDLGYVIGPRLNAAGRLDDMSRGVECLLTEDYQHALKIAQGLNELNIERRALEMKMEAQAYAALDTIKDDGERPFGLCVYQPGWHQGIIGLLAARLKERYHFPVIAFADESETTIKGSARSVSGLHIRDALDRIAKRYPHLLSKFGGHAMAAGLSIQKAHFAEFRDVFNQVVTELVCNERLEAVVLSDGELSLEHFNLQTANILRQGGPWGQGFTEPLFDGKFSVIEQKLVGTNHLKMLLMSPECDYCLDAIAFNIDTDKWPNERCTTISAAYRLDVNFYRGREKLQLLIEELSALQE
jgi:single-stranded-DNA-specific exonuclease